MKLEVGMYVRTKNGYIRKIDRIWNDTNFNVDKIYYNNNIYEDTLGCVLDEDIKGNPSFNITDLIEVGDYVNGYKVEEIQYHTMEDCNIDDGMKCLFLKGKAIGIYECDIKSIVTKEMFEAIKYEIN